MSDEMAVVLGCVVGIIFGLAVGWITGTHHPDMTRIKNIHRSDNQCNTCHMDWAGNGGAK